MVARSASTTEPRLHSSTKAASFGLLFAAWVASGCSAATAQKVTPIIVSARVVKTHSFSFFLTSPCGRGTEGEGEPAGRRPRHANTAAQVGGGGVYPPSLSLPPPPPGGGGEGGGGGPSG